MKFPPVTIVMTTYFPRFHIGWTTRVLAAKEAALSWRNKLQYEGPLHLHIADDGSDTDILEKFWLSINWSSDRTSMSRDTQGGVGASLNRGFRQAFDVSPFVLYLVDDWALAEPFNITPWVKLLLERQPEIGMVRLGPPHPFTTGKVEAASSDWNGWAVRFNRESFAFGHRPALYHKSFIDAYGYFKEGVSALECEKQYAEHFVISDGPDIVLALPHPWKHIYSIEMSSMDPTKRKF